MVASAKAKLRENASSLEVFAASEGHALNLARAHEKHFECWVGDFQAQTLVDPALTEPSVSLASRT